LIHKSLLYETEEEFLSGTLPFVLQGLEKEEPILAVTSHPNIQLLRGELGRDADKVEFVDASGWHQRPAIILGAYHRYATEHINDSKSVRVIGEPACLCQSKAQLRQWQCYESILNLALKPLEAHIVCPYDTRVVHPSIVEAVHLTHPHYLSADQVQDSPRYEDPSLFIQRVTAEGSEEPIVPVKELPIKSNLADVRRFFFDAGREAGLGGEAITSLVTAGNELAANAIKHTAGEGHIRLWSEPGEIVCEVVDMGPGIDNPLLGYLPPESDQEDGWGLWMVRQLCDSVEFSRGPRGSTVRIHFSAEGLVPEAKT
jgi:anti-sigma regulatory factor (Ser/Thr protein kinase)